jgi:hypothetical protein
MHHTNPSSFMHTLDHIHADPESKDHAEQVQVKATNPELKPRPGASHLVFLDFYFKSMVTISLFLH